MMGVYQITCTVNAKRYIGSSVDIKERWGQHRCDLVSKRHVNKHLQNVWNKHGGGCFRWEVVEVVWDENILLETEQEWLDAALPELNIAKCVSAPMLGKKASVDHKRKISEALKGRTSNRKGSKMSLASRRKISKSLKGNTYSKGKVATEETKRKMRESQRRRRMRENGETAEETREKLRQNASGKRHSPETRAKIASKLKAWHAKNDNPMKGRKRPDLSERNRQNAKG